MPDVFVSYRHGMTDSWAAISIADRINQHFSVFLDVNRSSMDLGAVFPAAIEEALSECRVLLAVIGPDWLSEESLRRLRREKDWVRQELRMALARPALRVVPLLIEPSSLPDASALPEDVAALVLRQARTLAPARMELESDDLIRRLEHWLSDRPGARERGTHFPAMLPYLCD